jgi:hypothetical protein
MWAVKAFLDGVEGAGANIAIHHSQSPQSQNYFFLDIWLTVRVAVAGRDGNLF